MIPITLYLRPETYRALEEMAEAERIKLSVLIRRFLEEATETEVRSAT